MIFSRIVGTGGYLPPRVVTNDEFAARLDTSDAWIRERTGIVERHIADASQTSSDLALEASRAALSAAGVRAEDIDLIVLATSTPDYVFPSTACLLQAKLGIKNCPAFDLQAVCSGFVYALATADNFIRAGTHRRALVVGAEVFSRILDWNDRGTCVLFGDGAGAVVLAAGDRPGVHASVLRADGSHAGILSVPGNVCGGSIVGSPYLQMQGSQVFKFAVKVLDEVARETVAAAGMQLGDIDWLIPHQANVRILEATARKLGLPLERLVVTVDHHGNTSAASVPLALDEFVRAGKIRPGHRVLLQGVGGGFTWGATLVTM
ncbi:MAG: ketoacyl-ACP synthase III [Betaproteobacteria bacterium]|nr:ketoacyl-ACP synthase III [Betaproteobacteria bacterium]MDH5222415.1 ketoacyl-ACP synthase III [Betaproteobacteria bacterium]MDH5352102.1 ketoacyl-ACP synthase III [Betaproteobacteria bacterium]